MFTMCADRSEWNRWRRVQRSYALVVVTTSLARILGPGLGSKVPGRGTVLPSESADLLRFDALLAGAGLGVAPWERVPRSRAGEHDDALPEALYVSRR